MKTKSSRTKTQSPDAAEPNPEVTASSSTTPPPRRIISEQEQIELVRNFMAGMCPKMRNAPVGDIIHWAKRFAPIFQLIFGKLVGANLTPWRIARHLCGESTNVPEWALVAWEKSFAGLKIDIDKLKRTDAREFGKLTGLLENVPLPEAFDVLQPPPELREVLNSWVNSVSRTEAWPFFDGVREGATTIKNKVEQPTQLEKIIHAIAFFWLEVEKMKSAAQLHRWLEDKRILAQQSDHAATRKACRSIGLSFRKGSQGRPQGKSGLYKDD